MWFSRLPLWAATAAMMTPVALVQVVAAQATNPVFTPVQPRYSRLRFSQSINIFEWLYRLNYNKNISKRFRFSLKEDFRTTLQKITDRDLWKDDQSLAVRFVSTLSDRITFVSAIDSRLLSDPLAGFDNNVTFNSAQARLNYLPRSNVRISPAVSAQWQRQLEQSDQGFGFGLSADVDRFRFDDYTSDLSFVGERSIFPRRTNDDIRLRYTVRREFYESTADTLSIVLDRLRRDSFDADGSDIFVRSLTQSKKGVENRLSYRLGPAAVLYARNAVMSTLFKVNNLKDIANELQKEDSGFESRHSLVVDIHKARWFSRFGWHFRSRTRTDKREIDRTPDPFGRFATVGFDSEDKLVELTARSGYAVGAADSLGVFAAISKFQYDTSDTLNPNDHDQVRWQFSFSHRHTFGEALYLLWSGTAFLNHFVFISGKFSSGNNWERVFQLSPEVVFRPARDVYFSQRFTVRAKYQTYDFDDPAISNRNIVNRQFIVSHVSRFPLFRNMQAELSVDFELAEQGKLFYSRWRQNLALSWRNQEVQLMLKRRFHSGFSISAGGSVFNQKRWRHKLNADGELERELQTSHTNWGPVLEMAYRPRAGVEVMFLGNIQVVNSSRRDTETINNFDVNVNWFF